MTDLLKDIPLDGTWVISSSERSYDWIGPDSTIPFAGHLFRAFDQYLPFTRMIRFLRKMFGKGSDSLDGSHTLTTLDCGAKLELIGMTFDRKGNTYEAIHNIEGTLHRYRLEVQSEKHLVGSMKFGIGDGAKIPPESLMQLEDAGIDAQALLSEIHMESDRPFTVEFAGSAEQEKQARRKIDACACRMAFGTALNSVLLSAMYSLPDWNLPGASASAIAAKFMPPVVQYAKPLMDGKPMGSSPTDAAEASGKGTSSKKDTGTTIASVNVKQPWFVAIENVDGWNKTVPVVQQSTAIHETVHQAQLRALRTETVAEHTADDNHKYEHPHDFDPDARLQDVEAIEKDYFDKETLAVFAAGEIEAYAAEYEFLTDWLKQNCKDSDNYSTSKLPSLDRDIYAEAVAAQTQTLDPTD